MSLGLRIGLILGSLISTLVLLLMLSNGNAFLLDPEGYAKRGKTEDGSHCLRGLQPQHKGFVDALDARINPKDRISVRKTQLGPIRQDGTHRIVVDYRFRTRSGQFADGRATGSVTNATCDFEIATLER